MHEAWCHFVRIKKLRSFTILDHALVKDPSSRPRHPPKHKVLASKSIKFEGVRSILTQILLLFFLCIHKFQRQKSGVHGSLHDMFVTPWMCYVLYITIYVSPWRQLVWLEFCGKCILCFYLCT